MLAALAAVGLRGAMPTAPEGQKTDSTEASSNPLLHPALASESPKPVSLWNKLGGGSTGLAAIIAAIAMFFGFGGKINPAPAPTPPSSPAPAPAPTPPTSPAPAPAPAPKPQAKADVWNALCKIQFGNAGCTATIIGPRRPDGRWDVLTACHCVRGQPTEGIAHTREGREFKIRVVATDDKSDVCWAVTESKELDELPFAYLADELPKPNDKVFHGGYGVDVPGNREEGYVVTPDNGAGQTQFALSVSSGDSGGGICTTAEGKVLSTVCCTTNRGAFAQVWGGHVLAIKKLRGQVNAQFPLWTPIETPLRAIEPTKIVVPQQMPSK